MRKSRPPILSREGSSHSFLFRHCLRSTERVYRLHTNTNTNTNSTSQNPNETNSDDVVSTLIEPDWQTPKYWCTEVGMRHMEAMGSHILQQVVEKELLRWIPSESQQTAQETPDHSVTPLTIQVRFLVDNFSQRDVDTALALSQGMQSMALTLSRQMNNTGTTNGSGTIGSIGSNQSRRRVVVTGLGGLDFAAPIFNPFNPDVYRPLTPDPTSTRTASLCDDSTLAQMTVEEIQAQVQSRLLSIPPPTILSLVSAVKLWMDAGLVANTSSAAASDRDVFPSVAVDTNKRAAVLTGPINWVKLGTQMLFYSRASNLSFRSVNGTTTTTTPVPITNDTMYALLQWHYWMRSVLNVETRYAAVTGAALARTIHDALLFEEQDDTHPTNDTKMGGVDVDTAAVEATTTITLLVGHDSNLNALATSWGVMWALDAPYETRTEWYATPPGSAMHVTRRRTIVDSNAATETTRATTTLELSYIYPVYSLNQSVTSIEIHHVPMHLSALPGEAIPISSKIVDNTTIVDWHEWVSRVSFLLKQYPGATECYNASGRTDETLATSSRTVSPPTTAATTTSPLYRRCLIASMFGNIALALMVLRQWFWRRRQRRRRRSTNGDEDFPQAKQEYNMVSSATTIHNDLT